MLSLSDIKKILNLNYLHRTNNKLSYTVDGTVARTKFSSIFIQKLSLDKAVNYFFEFIYFYKIVFRKYHHI